MKAVVLLMVFAVHMALAFRRNDMALDHEIARLKEILKDLTGKDTRFIHRSRSLGVEQDSRRLSVEEDPHSNSVEEDQRSLSVEEDPHSNSVEQDPHSSSVEQNSRTKHVELNSEEGQAYGSNIGKERISDMKKRRKKYGKFKPWLYALHGYGHY